MQTPHDPEVTYSGHKGKGYEVEVSETCEEGNAVQVITHVEVTPSSGGDAGVTVGVTQFGGIPLKRNRQAVLN